MIEHPTGDVRKKFASKISICVVRNEDRRVLCVHAMFPINLGEFGKTLSISCGRFHFHFCLRKPKNIYQLKGKVNHQLVEVCPTGKESHDLLDNSLRRESTWSYVRWPLVRAPMPSEF